MAARGSILGGETERGMCAETRQSEFARGARKGAAKEFRATREEAPMKRIVRGMRGAAGAVLFLALCAAALPAQAKQHRANLILRQASMEIFDAPNNATVIPAQKDPQCTDAASSKTKIQMPDPEVIAASDERSGPQARGTFAQAAFRKKFPARDPAPQERPEPPASAANVVSGTATLRERMALPPGAYFEAALLELSAGGAPDAIIATARVENPGAPPIRFAIAYDGARINEGRTYVVRATISAGGHALYASEAAYPVITHGNPKRVDIVMRRASGEPKPEKTSK